MGLSRSEYARHRGVSRQAIAKALAAGRISLESDGTIDPRRADAAWASSTNPNRKHVARRAAAPRPVHRQGDDDAGAGGELEQDEGAARRILQQYGKDVPGRLKLNDARLANELWKATKQQIEVRKARGELVTIRVMQKRVGDLAMAIRESLLNWPAKRAQAVAERIGVGDTVLVQIALEQEIREFLIGQAAPVLGEPAA
ncbi:MAG TPA: hypothetical protein VNH45_03470 [Gaiellaceae bacterium]|nr:hypothetical protein [Gaiellaceae bacterium]